MFSDDILASDILDSNVEVDRDDSLLNDCLCYYVPIKYGDGLEDITQQEGIAAYINGATSRIDQGDITSYYSGGNDRAEVSSLRNIGTDLANYTIILEFATPAAATTQVVAEQLEGAGNGSWGIYIDTGDTLHWFSYITSDQDDDSNINVRDGSNERVMCVLVRDEETQLRYFYINDQYATASDTMSGTATTTENIYLGGRGDNTFAFTGDIFRFAFINRALNQGEARRIIENRNAGLRRKSELIWVPPVAVGGGFQAAWARQQSGIIGAR